MTYRPNRVALRKLQAIANRQGGYFTAKQAERAGYGYTHLGYHASVGNFERVDHGLYRLPSVPVSDHDDLIRLSLWSRDRDDHPQAIVSHVTALVVHGLTDLLPRSTHFSVPKRFFRKPPRGFVLHRRVLEAGDVERHAGFAVTTPLRTLIDAASTVEVGEDELARAVAAALDRGLVRRSEIVAAVRDAEGGERIQRALKLQRSRSK